MFSILVLCIALPSLNAFLLSPVGGVKTCSHDTALTECRARRAGTLEVDKDPVAVSLESLKIGTKLKGTVIGEFEGKTGFKAYVDVPITRKGEKGRDTPVRAMVRAPTPQARKRLALGEYVSCFVVNVQPSNGRLEASLVRPKPPQIRVKVSPDELRPLRELETGMKLRGTVVNVQRFGAFVSCGVGVEGKNGVLKPVNGYLRSQDLVEGTCLETALVKQQGTVRVIEAGDEIDVWVKKTWPSEKRFCLTLKEDITAEEVQELARQNMRLRRQSRRRRKTPLEDFTEGKELVGEVYRTASYGLLINIGAAKPAILHVKEIFATTGMRIQKGWEYAVQGEFLRVIIKKREEDRIELSLIGKTEPPTPQITLKEITASQNITEEKVDETDSNARVSITPARDTSTPKKYVTIDEQFTDEDSEDDSSDEEEFDPNSVDYSAYDDY